MPLSLPDMPVFKADIEAEAGGQADERPRLMWNIFLTNFV